MSVWTGIGVLLAGLGLAACSPGSGPSGEKAKPPGLENGSFTAQLNGFDIHYEVHGSGPVVMVVPNSWGFDVAGLRGVFGPLEERLTLVYFDPRGMGESGPVVEDADMGLAAVRVDFDALRRYLGLEKVAAIGWSNGAMNLLLVASEYPDAIDSAIFVHGAPAYTEEDARRFAEDYPELMASFQALQERLQDPDLTDDDKTAMMHRVWIEEFFPASCANAETTRPLLRETFKKESFCWRHASYSNQEAPFFDARDQLPAITARSLVIVGTHDMLPVSAGEEMRDGIAGAQLVVLQDSGHFAFLEEPERFREIVWSFLGV